MSWDSCSNFSHNYFLTWILNDVLLFSLLDHSRKRIPDLYASVDERGVTGGTYPWNWTRILAASSAMTMMNVDHIPRRGCYIVFNVHDHRYLWNRQTEDWLCCLGWQSYFLFFFNFFRHGSISGTVLCLSTITSIQFAYFSRRFCQAIGLLAGLSVLLGPVELLLTILALLLFFFFFFAFLILYLWNRNRRDSKLNNCCQILPLEHDDHLFTRRSRLSVCWFCTLLTIQFASLCHFPSHILGLAETPLSVLLGPWTLLTIQA